MCVLKKRPGRSKIIDKMNVLGVIFYIKISKYREGTGFYPKNLNLAIAMKFTRTLYAYLRQSFDTQACVSLPKKVSP